MKKYILLTTLFIYLLTHLNAQRLINLTGDVNDNNSHALAGAIIHLLNTNLQTTTDTGGRFIFPNVPAGTYTLQVAALGFATTTVTVSSDNKSVTITLQPDVQQLDEVIVTAQKREENNQQLPISITALSSKKTAAYRIWNTKDMTAIVPNLYAADPGDKRNITAIRGIATTSYDQAVATYIDGVNQFGLDTYISPLFDVERIEVLRGPQGTLYGRNAMGGVVNIVTKQPTNHLSGFAEASVGNYGLQRYTAGIKAPLIKDKLYMGAAGLYERTNGFYTNDFNNSHYDRQHSIGGNYYLKFIANKQWSFMLNAKHNNNRNHGPFPLVADRDEAFNHAYHVSQNATTQLIDNIINTSLSANYSGRHFNFSSQTAYQYNYRIYAQPIDADFSPLDALSIINNYGKSWNTVKVWTQEFRFSSSAAAASPFKWVAGTFLFTQNSPVKQATHFGNDATLLGSPDSNYALLSTTIAKKYGAAVYGQITYVASSKFNVIAGLRYDYEHQQQHILGEYFKDGIDEALFNFQPDTSATIHFNAWSPKLGIDYSINKKSLLFATYSKGYRAGGLTPLSPTDPSQLPLYAFKPEYSSNIEAGIKNSLFNHRLLLNITAFYTTVTDAQVPTLILPDAVTITRNTGKLTSKGLEAEVNAVITKGLTTDYSFGYTNALYDNLKISSNGGELNLKGNRQVFTPNTTSMLALQYSFAAGTKTTFAIRGEWKWLGKQYFDLANTIAQNQYSLFNAQATAAYRQWSLKLWSRNITGKKYIAYAYDFGAIHLGDPATYGATLQFKF
ncbi:TonB-dependent receptor [Ilyomonas limi]|uniref:TonB-dependent receptor n=1 Tax=Ilyomonas limi TaxID=2575867 RepID=A0A4U3KTN0_9BACT|nr:TonB-dependent receptor [Ilyomonas limi]TKK65682.1 TonB-dependent receptor [Ilyomonas limi]